MHSFSTIDLANVLAEARREELAAALRARPGPLAGLRTALGRGLVAAGQWIMYESETRTSSATAVGA